MRELKIAYGDSRLSKRWVNKKTTFDELCERFRTARRTTETVAEYRKFTKDRRDAAAELLDPRGAVARAAVVKLEAPIAIEITPYVLITLGQEGESIGLRAFLHTVVAARPMLQPHLCEAAATGRVDGQSGSVLRASP